MTVGDSASEISKIKVAVRVRPFNKREQDLKTKCVVSMENNQTFLYSDEKQPKTFAFDHCFDSADPSSAKFTNQEEVFTKVGSDVIDNSFQGYNACIFAYGQTGSGKSYTMMGSPDNPGIIPRLCNAIFERIDQETSDTTNFKVEVSYMEIYNERVRDLLDPKKSAKTNLKVREHKSLGPTVDGLSVLAVSSFDQISGLLDEGNKCRTVAATNMNTESSRSHAVFTIRLTHTLHDLEKGFSGEKVSKISLVDLAGSERAGKTGAMGKRLEEGGNINKSLTTLGMVISALAEKQGKKEKFVPYRDSVLTWLLKDNLGGNSRTVMIATISPAADNYEETLSTLRYADRAKKIVNHAVINEDPNAKVIRELREEVEVLKLQICQTKERETEYEELKERLAESERLVEMMNKSWEERLRETDVIYEERQKDLAQIGISVAESGIKVEKNRFYLVNLNADPSMNELLVYYINKKAVIGSGIEPEGESGESRPMSPEEKVDFVLEGLGIHPRHALLEILEDPELKIPRLYVTSLNESARVCINGKPVIERTILRNGNRLLIGHNHFFRVNCPKDPRDDNSLMVTSMMMEESQFFDYDKAWMEANSEEQSMTHAVDQYLEQISIKHQEEKQAALEKQYEEFERYIHGLTQTLQTPSTPMTPGFGIAMTPVASTPSCGLPPIAFPPNPRNIDKNKFIKWARNREEVFKESLKSLKVEIVKANALVREANMIADEIMANKRGQTRYDVTLQIPACNLRPSRIKSGSSVCEPVIVVRRNGMQGYQLWSVEQLENKLIDMREMYAERHNGNDTMGQSTSESVVSDSPTGNSASSGICEDEEDEESEGSLIDTFFESQEKHSLIGVANVFLEVLFHDMKLDYHVPIISQQGEVCGKLHVEVYRIPNLLNTSDSVMSDSTDSIESGSSGGSSAFLGKTIRCRIRIKKATNLPPSLSHFVFCQYSFFNISEMLVVAPTFDPSTASSERVHPAHATNVQFNHDKDFDVLVTEEFIEYVQEDALSIEVWGHRSAGLGNDLGEDGEVMSEVALKQKGLQERWSEVTNRIELWVDIKELNENGDYASVEVDSHQPRVVSGGVYQLKQGQQRRVTVRVKSLPERGNLPINFIEVSTVSIGSIVVKDSDDEKQLDSYQEEDLDKIREQWTVALSKRQKYLEQQINALSEKGATKTELDNEREQSLINQWVALTEERNAVAVPALNSHIPGAPADWQPPKGIEKHVPVVFLDINPEELAAEDTELSSPSAKVAGLNTLIPSEDCSQMISLPILEKDTVEMTATCSWDSSAHACPVLNRATNSGERIYAIVRVVVRLSQPLAADLVIRKRICLNVYKKPSFTERLMKKIVGGESLFGTGVYYDIVGHIPKATLDMEDRETLAMMAARHTSANEDDSTENRHRPSPSKMQSAYIEAYTKSIRAVEYNLKYDRMRQENAILNMLNKHERAARLSGLYGLPSNSFMMKRTVSLPNTINNVSLPPIPPSQHHRYSNQTSSGLPPSGPASDKVMEMSTASSSGYSSMVNSLVSPMMEYGGRLSGIDEEQQFSEILTKEPVRSFTVPETLHSTNQHFSPKAVSPRILSDLNQDTPEGSNASFSCSNHLFNEAAEQHPTPRRPPSVSNKQLELDGSHS